MFNTTCQNFLLKRKLPRRIILTLLICGILPFDALSLENQNYPFDSLCKRLVKDGFDKHYIDDIFRDPRSKLNFKDVSLFFVHSEAKLNYDQFTSKNSIANARKYMNEHISDLKTAESVYGVNKEIITAILLVETRLGQIMGTSPIMNTLSTMASLSEPAIRENLWHFITNPSKRIPRYEFEKKANIKSKWAYKELKAFIEYTGSEQIDPFNTWGSYAGAVGIAQFMPTSIMAYAQDGNGDGKIDLFDHSDAIASTANYLKNFGWQPGINEKKAKKVIYFYNRSNYYVNTIWKISELLRK
jgi:membrane-bound lytic murein transglycosylase B